MMIEREQHLLAHDQSQKSRLEDFVFPRNKLLMRKWSL